MVFNRAPSPLATDKRRADSALTWLIGRNGRRHRVLMLAFGLAALLILLVQVSTFRWIQDDNPTPQTTPSTAAPEATRRWRHHKDLSQKFARINDYHNPIPEYDGQREQRKRFEAAAELHELDLTSEDDVAQPKLRSPELAPQEDSDGAIAEAHNSSVGNRMQPSNLAVGDLNRTTRVESVDPENKMRLQSVKEAFRHSWKGYKRYAFGCDEFLPVSLRGKNWMRYAEFGFGVTMLDGMTTAWLMGLHDVFNETIRWVRDNLDFDKDVGISAFESTIRILGSLLSAYELSGEQYHWLVDKAVDLADRLLHAYNTSTGLPHSTVNLKTKEHGSPQWVRGASTLSEVGTIQLEMKTLSFHSGRDIYDKKATRVMNVLRRHLPPNGLAPTYIDPTTGRWTTEHVSLGALGDSYYEYLLKQWLITGKVEDHYRAMFEQAASGVIRRLIHKTGSPEWTYIAQSRQHALIHKMDHLACFAGGWFALAAQTVGGPNKDKWISLAANITATCYQMYNMTETGLAPEVTDFQGGTGMNVSQPQYLLRPETVESIFYMWRMTKDQKYRDWGWAIFQAIQKWCSVPSGGYTGIKDVRVIPPEKDDQMQSFWMAETLKYLYLLFAEDEVLDLSQWVLNTEAHPLRIRRRPNTNNYWEAESTPNAQEAVGYALDLNPKKTNA